MFTINTVIRPLSTADSEYSVCGNSVLRKAKVVKTFARNAAGNNITIEILEHADPSKVGKKYLYRLGRLSEMGEIITDEAFPKELLA